MKDKEAIKRKVSNLLDGVKEILRELEGIRASTESRGDHQFVREKLRRWKARAVEYLRRNVSEEEAGRLERVREYLIVRGDPREMLIETIGRYDSYMRALLDEIARHPETVLRKSGEGEGLRTKEPQRLSAGDFDLDFLHSRLIEKCADHFQNGKFDDVILNACKVVEVYTRERANLQTSAIGVSLMRKVFKPDQPILKYSDDNGEQEALMHLFSGFIGVFKNPQSHRFVNVKDPLVAFEVLALADRLCKILEQTQFQT